MGQGLFWSVLLVFFVLLAWAGWREYQKVEAYRRWAAAFERAKYDIYAVLGQQGRELTWGQPTVQGPMNLQTLSLDDVQQIHLQVDRQVIDLEQPPHSGRRILLELQIRDRATPVQIPFTEIPLAIAWTQWLQQQVQ